MREGIALTIYIILFRSFLCGQQSLSAYFTETQGACSNLQPYQTKEAPSAVECLSFCISQSKCNSVDLRKHGLDKKACNLFETKPALNLLRNEKCAYYEKTDFVKIKKPSDCRSRFEDGERRNGVYNFDLEGMGTVKVYCVMDTSSGGWTVFHNRFNGSVNFNQSWQSYKKGFGDISGEHWLGFNVMLAIMKQRSRHRLRVDLESFDGNRSTERYSTFQVTGDRYMLTIAGHTGNFEDLIRHDQELFATYDMESEGGCAKRFGGGWWYRDCFRVNLNGIYRSTKVRDKHTMCWKSFTDGCEGLKSARMMFT